MEHVKYLRFANILSEIDLATVLHYQEQVVFIDMQELPKEASNIKRLPLKIEAITFVVVEKGELKINIDYTPYSIGKNMLLALSERFIFQILSVSKDFKGYFIIAKPNYLRGLIDNERPPIDGNFQFRVPIISLKESEFGVVKDCLKRLQWNMQRENHSYQKKLIEHSLADFFFEVWNFRMLKLSGDSVVPIFGNRENIATAFFKLLLTNSRKERDVVFYANKLHVTPVYLSRVVKSVLGLPALKFIHNIILSDAELLLRSKKMTIQQIAEELNFPDQATFSKFFKKHIGLSPIKYREQNLS